MSLKQQLIDEMKQALKAKNQDKLDTLRLLLSELKNFEIDHGEQDDQGVQQVIARLVKQWQDALIDYQNAKRGDLIKETEFKLKILTSYLPQQLADEDLKRMIKDVVAASQNAAKQNQQLGPIIGQVMAKVKGQADGGRVAALVKEIFNQ